MGLFDRFLKPKKVEKPVEAKAPPVPKAKAPEKTAKQLATEGIEASVVSIPSWEIFAEQSRAYKNSVLPPTLPKVAIEAAVKELEEVVKGDDKEAIEAKTEALMQASHKVAEKMYAEQAAPEAGAAPAGDGANAKDDGNVVDAEFTEVKDK